MLIKNLQLTVKNWQSIKRVIGVELCLNIQSLKYSRFTARKPVSIVNKDELFDINLENVAPPLQFKVEKKIKSLTSKFKLNETPKSNAQINENVTFEINDDKLTKPKNSKAIFTKLQENEKLVSSLMMSLKSRKRRKKNDQILVEGVCFIKDAMEANVIPETIIFSRWEDIKDIKFDEHNTKLYKVPYRTIQLWSTLTTPPGVMGIFKKPEPKKVSKSSLPLTIICDNIRDPGNMGSILRAAAGVGCEKVFLTKGCVDFWDPKVLRSAAGAHFRIPIFGTQEWDDIRLSLNSDAHVYLADSNVSSVEYEETEIIEEIIAEEKENEEKPCSKFKKLVKKNKYNSLIRYGNIPVVPYYSVDYAQNEVILIVGGEAEGLSQDSFKLIEDRQGVRVNIPLHNGIDSLNAGMALGVIAFEVKRQFLQVQSRLKQLEQ